MTTRYLKLSLLTAMTMAGSAFAQTTYVDFGNAGNYDAGSNINLRGAGDTAWTANNNVGDFDADTVSDDVRRSIAFSDSTALSPAANWSGTSGVFFGGAQVTRLNSATMPVTGTFATTVNNAGGDRVRLGVNVDASNRIDSVQGLFFWKKSDFLNGGDVATIGLDTTSAFSVNIVTGGVSGGDGARVRFVVQNGSQFYVSSVASQTVSNGGTATFNLTGAALMTTEVWDDYAPTSNLTWASGGTTISSTALNDIQAVGFYVIGTGIAAADRDFNFTFNDFSFTGTAIPEPSGFATLAGLGMLGVVALRRRR